MEKTEENSNHNDPVRTKLLNIVCKRANITLKVKESYEESYQNISMLQKTETEIIKIYQPRDLWKEIEAVNAGNRVSGKSSTHKLGPFLDKVGVLRVGGRLLKSNLSHELKYPVLVHKYCTISQLIIRYYHEKAVYSGRG